jgi:hypothetical protein
MTMSAEFCRLQAALQQQRAAESPLDNVRRIAALAASTWEGEALAAERRESRRLGARAATEAKQHARDDGVVSENPDRGLAAKLALAEPTTAVRWA